MYSVRTYNAIASQGLARFPPERYRVGADIREPDALLVRSHKLLDEPLPATLKAIARAGAGVNNVPVERCTEHGVIVFNTPGANANAVKEAVLAGLLLSARDLCQGLRYVAETDGSPEAADPRAFDTLIERQKKRFAGSELAGKQLGVVGLGNIGSRVANMGLALSMQVLGYDPAISVEAAWRLSSNVQKMDNLTTLFARSDYISLHLPALESTRGLVGEPLLAAVKPGASLLNFARGEIVDTSAVLGALAAGRLYRYVTDFPVPALLGHPQVLQLPHLGASTREAEQNCAVMAADRLIEFLENGNVRHSVNFPDTELERTTPYRVTVSNRNVARVLGQITAIFAESDINIADMLNKSRDQVAYNIIDTDQQPSAAMLASLQAIDEVIAVRVFE